MDTVVLVDAHGEMLDNIETQVSSAVDHVQDRNKALYKAKRLQKKIKEVYVHWISGFHPGDPGSIPGNGTFFSASFWKAIVGRSIRIRIQIQRYPLVKVKLAQYLIKLFSNNSTLGIFNPCFFAHRFEFIQLSFTFITKTILLNFLVPHNRQA
ncbi:unnamed protein product [Lactuca saligna]|uniref:t-SNARE coiled-coil homology domain-containing protein n=1 Tax=Lactuca saligna TaxID=75948 RepID=A0AA35VKV3_LACSI|nr:unnamed protein product [Lactuca saligna]